MKEIENYIKKNTKSAFLIFVSLILLLIALIICLFALYFKDSETKTVKENYKGYNKLENKTLCKTNTMAVNDTVITLEFCGDKVSVYDQASSTEISSTDTTCAKPVEDVYLDIDNIYDFYYSFSLNENKYYYYVLTNDGKVYTTNQDKLVEKDYSLTQVENLSDIVDLEEYIEYEGTSSVFEKKLYAIDKNGNLHEILVML